MFRKKSLLILLAMPFLVAYISDAQVCETPNNNRAILFQPCTWDVGSAAGPLKNLVADNQHYTYTEISDASATVNSFCATSGTGALQVVSHGSPNALLVEAYSPDSAGRAACSTSWNNLLAAGFTKQQITHLAARDFVGYRDYRGRAK